MRSTQAMVTSSGMLLHDSIQERATKQQAVSKEAQCSMYMVKSTSMTTTESAAATQQMAQNSGIRGYQEKTWLKV
jgi:hypothetical protein